MHARPQAREVARMPARARGGVPGGTRGGVPSIVQLLRKGHFAVFDEFLERREAIPDGGTLGELDVDWRKRLITALLKSTVGKPKEGCCLPLVQ
jgi:hypothetical protein